jgi:membrane protein implicated in regulation of membrane protease activity
MSGGQIAALVFAVILLIPGGCFMVFGIGMLTDNTGYRDVGPPLLLVGLAIFSVAGLLGWVAFRKRNPPQPPSPPNA